MATHAHEDATKLLEEIYEEALQAGRRDDPLVQRMAKVLGKDKPPPEPKAEPHTAGSKK